MSEPSTAQPDDERPVTATPAERGNGSDSEPVELDQDDELRAGQIGPDDTRP